MEDAKNNPDGHRPNAELVEYGGLELPETLELDAEVGLRATCKTCNQVNLLEGEDVGVLHVPALYRRVVIERPCVVCQHPVCFEVMFEIFVRAEGETSIDE